jgi:hypothetical protein
VVIQTLCSSQLDAGAALGPPRSQLGVDQMALLPINLMTPLSMENAAHIPPDCLIRASRRLTQTPLS